MVFSFLDHRSLIAARQSGVRHLKYDKPALTVEAQAALLLKRGLIGEAQLIEERLRAVGYYRLSGYWYPFRKQDPKGSGIYASEFDTGSSFTDVWARYAFDRQLRVIVLDAIERIEVAVRSELATRHAARHGPFAYAEDASSFPHLLQDDWNQLLSQCGLEQNKSQDQFVKHFAARKKSTHANTNSADGLFDRSPRPASEPDQLPGMSGSRRVRRQWFMSSRPRDVLKVVDTCRNVC